MKDRIYARNVELEWHAWIHIKLAAWKIICFYRRSVWLSKTHKAIRIPERNKKNFAIYNYYR